LILSSGCSQWMMFVRVSFFAALPNRGRLACRAGRRA
jgi:hypothetical protein